MASIALICIARHAGISPASRPLNNKITVAATAIWMLTSGCSIMVPLEAGWALMILSTRSSRNTPALNPNKPAKAVSSRLSLMICEMMIRGRAPRARRTPISCVRSRTMTSMMLLTPTSPASSVPIPTIQVSVPIPPNSELNLLTCSPRFCE